MISPDDLDLLFVTDDLDEVVERVRDGYEQRSLGDAGGPRSRPTRSELPALVTQ